MPSRVGSPIPSTEGHRSTTAILANALQFPSSASELHSPRALEASGNQSSPRNQLSIGTDPRTLESMAAGSIEKSRFVQAIRMLPMETPGSAQTLSGHRFDL